jgi:thiol-disulfide isomerase/thioredoxin
MNNIYPRVEYYTAKWCSPCQKISPDIDKLTKDYPKITFFKIDVDEHQLEVVIDSVPTFYFYKNVLLSPVIVKGANLEKIKESIKDI